MKKKIIIILSIIGVIALIGIGYIFRDDLFKFKRNIYPIHSVMKSDEKEEELHNEICDILVSSKSSFIKVNKKDKKLGYLNRYEPGTVVESLNKIIFFIIT